MREFCVQLVISLFMLLLWLPPQGAAAEAPASPALLQATKPAVARDLLRQQQREAAKHHGHQGVCRDHMKSAR